MNVAGIVKRKTQALSRLQIVKNFLPPVQQAREQERRERSPERKGSLGKQVLQGPWLPFFLTGVLKISIQQILITRT